MHLDKTDAGMTVTRIDLETIGDVPGIDDAEFQRSPKRRKDELPDLPPAVARRRDHPDRQRLTATGLTAKLA